MNDSQQVKMNDSHLFNTGEIVWSKLKGHPWWPSIILSQLPAKQAVPELRYKVNFLASK